MYRRAGSNLEVLLVKEATAVAVASDRLIDYIEDFARKTFMVINRRQ
jgi:hypothetical protein